MTASTEGSSTTSRGKRIPGTLVLNWQAAEGNGTKPLIRRPPTACESCRTAKVKCDGKSDCSRCKVRGLSCIYTPKPNRPGTQMRQQTPRTTQSQLETRDSASSAGDHMSDEMSLDLGILPETSSDEPGYSFTPPEDPEWPDDSFHNSISQFDWSFPDKMDITSSLAMGLHDAGDESPQLDMDTPVISLPNLGPDPSSLHHLSVALMQPGVFTNCQCLMHLMSQVPNLGSVIQEVPKPSLDKIFKITEETIQNCTLAVNCLNCKITSVELVCILTVFQQTGFCFNQIVKSGFGNRIKIAIGDYQVRLNDDPKFKSILVLNLVKQASSLLDTIDLRRQSFLLPGDPSQNHRRKESQSSEGLDRLNLHYTQEVITNFRKLFRLITDVYEGKEVDDFD